MTYAPEVVADAVRLLEAGASLTEVSRRTGASRAAIAAWRDGRRPRPPRHACPRCEASNTLDTTSYAYLLGMYLGDGTISRQQERPVFALRIACDARYVAILDECERAMRAVLPNRVSRTPEADSACVVLTAYSKHWPCLFPQHGPGPKHRRRIALEPWQQQVVDEHPGLFVRGLFHSDGCRVTNRVRSRGRIYEYPRYFFTNASDDIRALCCDALDRLGIAWRRTSEWNISVARREAVAALDLVVGAKR